MTSSFATCGGGWWDRHAVGKLVVLFLLSFSGTMSTPSYGLSGASLGTAGGGDSDDYAPPQTYHRCRSLSRNGTTHSLLEDLQQSPCRPCEFDSSTILPSYLQLQQQMQNNPHSSLLADMHVVVLLSTQSSFEKSMVTTSGLLSQGIRVTMLAAPNMPPETAIRPALTQHMPCTQQGAAQARLAFKTFYYNPQSLPCLLLGDDPLPPFALSAASAGDIMYCSILNAASLVQGISEVLTTVHQPTVLLMDATEVAGLLIAEHFLIPSLMIVEHAAVLKYVLGDPLQQLSCLHPAYWARLLQDRLASLDLTGAFVALNRVRRTLGLPRLRTVADLWRAPGGVLWSAAPPARQWHQAALAPNLLVRSGPFLPPCVPCDAGLWNGDGYAGAAAALPDGRTQAAVDRQPSIIVSAAFHDDEYGRRNLRTLLNGLEIARESIKQFNDVCPISNYRQSNETATANGKDTPANCWRGPEDFRVVLSGANLHNMELPPHVVNVESAFLDILATFEPTVALVSLCDPGNGWTRMLGPPVLCLDLNWSPKELALQLLRVLQTHPPDQPLPQQLEDDEDDVLNKIIHVLEEMSKAKLRDGDNWSSGWEMGQDIMVRLNLLTSEATSLSADPFHLMPPSVAESYLLSVSLYPALAIVLFALLYLLTRDSVQALLLHVRPRRVSRRPAVRLVLAGLAQGLLQRLPELDQWWTLWRAWVREISHQMTDPTSSGDGGNALTGLGPANGASHGSATGNGSSHIRKRHKPTKKRN